MKIKMLGNNGGLGDPTQTNSSFLIDLYDDHSEYLLFDCGYNVMARLVEEEANDPHFEIAKIKHLIISHKHDDHCGNMETLIYWNHFKNNVQMNIYVACKGLAKTVKDTRKIEENFKTIEAETYESLTIIEPGKEIYRQLLPKNYACLYFIRALHGDKPALSIGVTSTSSSRKIFISGDTKANKMFQLLSNAFGDNTLIFHDYSNWDDESKNVHACATDFEREYSKEFQDKAIKYHTGSEDFNREWQ